MRVAFDSVILGAYLHPRASYPKSVDRVPERLDHLVESLAAARATIIIPAPALSEFLVLAGSDAPLYLADLTNSPVFVVEPFDLRAAVEAAESQLRAMGARDKKAGATGSWQKVKVDRQIVAIAKVHAVDELYTEDEDVRQLAEFDGITVKGVQELPLPPADQQDLFPTQEQASQQPPSVSPEEDDTT